MDRKVIICNSYSLIFMLVRNFFPVFMNCYSIFLYNIMFCTLFLERVRYISLIKWFFFLLFIYSCKFIILCVMYSMWLMPLESQRWWQRISNRLNSRYNIKRRPIKKKPWKTSLPPSDQRRNCLCLWLYNTRGDMHI